MKLQKLGRGIERRAQSANFGPLEEMSNDKARRFYCLTHLGLRQAARPSTPFNRLSGIASPFGPCQRETICVHPFQHKEKLFD